MKYIFSDTNLFIDAVSGSDSENILNFIIEQLTQRKMIFIIPEVIKIEILTQYNYWKQEMTETIKSQLDIKKILDIEVLTDKNKKKQKREIESEKINNLLDPHRIKIIKKIEDHYELISKKIEKIFKHKNTRIISLTDKLLIAGMKRSVLKKSPYTRIDKGTENAHTKDIDCVAFESITDFCENLGETNKDVLIMCVSDKDYFSTNGNDLHSDLKKDIKMENIFYMNIREMLEKEFRLKSIKEKNKKTEKLKNTLGSLTGSNGSLMEIQSI